GLPEWHRRRWQVQSAGHAVCTPIPSLLPWVEMHIPRKPGFLRAVTENGKYAVVCVSRPTKVGNDTPILEDALPGIIHLGVILRPSTGVSQRAPTHSEPIAGMAFLHRFVCKPFG